MLLAKLYWRPTLSCALSPKGRQPREGGGPIDLEGSLHEGEAQSPGDEADVAADRAGAAQANSSSPPALDGLQGRKEDNKPLARRLIALFESVLEPVANRMNLQLAKRLGHFKSSVTALGSSCLIRAAGTFQRVWSASFAKGLLSYSLPGRPSTMYSE